MWECVGMCAGCVCVTCVWYVCTEQSRMNTLSVKHGFQHTSKGKHQQQVETHTDTHTHTAHTAHTYAHSSRTYITYIPTFIHSYTYPQRQHQQHVERLGRNFFFHLFEQHSNGLCHTHLSLCACECVWSIIIIISSSSSNNIVIIIV